MKKAKDVTRREKVREMIVAAAAISDVGSQYLKTYDGPESVMTAKDLEALWKRVRYNLVWLNKVFNDDKPQNEGENK